jgi:uncharacterized protein YlxW (UPF0749 family)
VEITIALAISIIGCVISISSFVLSRKDKAVKDTKEVDEESSNQKLLNYRLEQVEKKLDKVLDILDSYEKEIDDRVNKALEQHIKIYHK